MIYDKRDWTITFNDGSTASYYQMTALEALNISANEIWSIETQSHALACGAKKVEKIA